ncbi:MAG TPA: hypothetical protein VJA16_03540 [Thermoanaerobaculia bacterium]
MELIRASLVRLSRAGRRFDAGERSALVSGADSQSQVISDEGEWYPETDVDEETATDLKRVFGQLNNLPPAQRLAILKKMSAKMPLSGLYDSSVVQELLAGGGDPVVFHRGFTKGVASRPRVFIEHYLEGNALTRKLALVAGGEGLPVTASSVRYPATDACSRWSRHRSQSISQP